MYGVVEDSDKLLRRFYEASQGPDEKVSTWSCHLEDILDRAHKQGAFPGQSLDDVLMQIFWNGLRSELKQAA